jgi:hypothetical protein
MTDYLGTLHDDERSFDQRQRSATKVQVVTTILTTAFLPTLAKKCRPGEELKRSNSQKNKDHEVKKRQKVYTK